MPASDTAVIDVSLRRRHRLPFFFLMGLFLLVGGAMGASWLGSDERPVGLLVGAGTRHQAPVNEGIAWGFRYS